MNLFFKILRLYGAKKLESEINQFHKASSLGGKILMYQKVTQREDISAQNYGVKSI